MIPSGREIAHALYGAYRLARRDPSGLQHFEVSLEAFWRSFFAAALSAPGYALLVALDLDARAAAGADLDWGRAVAVNAVAYVAGWVAFPLVMIHLSGALGRAGAYLGYIVAYNWCAVLQMAAYLAAAGLRGALPGGAADLATLAVLAGVLVYQWYVAKTALEIAALPALAVVALDIAIGLGLAAVASALGG